MPRERCMSGYLLNIVTTADSLTDLFIGDNLTYDIRNVYLGVV